jgi:hypothetical protein
MQVQNWQQPDTVSDFATTAKRDKKAHRAFLYHLNRPALSGYPSVIS